MADLKAPMISSGDPTYTEICQVTVLADTEMAQVNQLLADGWRLVDIGHRPDATVFVMGRSEGRPKARTGFLAPEK